MDNNFLNYLIIFKFIAIFWLNIGTVEGIAGGHDPSPNTAKYTVSIQANGLHICNGAILDEKHVVTAARCFLDSSQNFENYEYSIIAGTYNTRSQDSSKIQVNVKKIYIPISFKKRNYPLQQNSQEDTSDIAVLKLEKKLVLNAESGLIKVSVPSRILMTYENEEFLVSGFGYTTRQIQIFSSYGGSQWQSNSDLQQCISCFEMKYARTKMIPESECSSKHGFSISSDQFCSQVKQSDDKKSLNGLCKGDIGDPLVANGNTLLGIFVHGPNNCNESEKAGIYTTFALHLHFVNDVMNNQKSAFMRVASYIIKKKIIGQNKKVLIEES